MSAALSDKARSLTEPPLSTLQRLLSLTADSDFLTMVWAIHAVQSGRAKYTRPYISVPTEAETAEVISKFRIHPWELETLAALNFTTPNVVPPYWLKTLALQTGQWDGAAIAVNLLKEIENAESKERISTANILLELHRIGHRQFVWQRGWGHISDLYRHLYIYGQGECSDYFVKKHGISVGDFVSVAFALYCILQTQPWCEPLQDVAVIGISNEVIPAALNILSDEILATRRNSKQLLADFSKKFEQKIPTAYHPSYLRLKPIIRRASDGLIIAPLPELILMRATVGLYYDMQSAGTSVTNDATERFESYSRRIIEAYAPRLSADPSISYTHNKNIVASADILIKFNGSVHAVIECKATKLTYDAQFRDDPISSASGYVQIAKAVYQLWRFFAHVRLGLISEEVNINAAAVVLTLEPWLQASHELREAVIAHAEEMTKEKAPEIEAEDKRYPVFCSVAELEQVLSTSTEIELFETFSAASDQRFHGWELSNIRDEVVDNRDTKKSYPMDLSNFLPWWKARG